MNDKLVILGIRESGCGNLMCRKCMVKKNRDSSEEDLLITEKDGKLNYCDYCDEELK